MYRGCIAAAERRGVPEHALRVTLCGGAPLPAEVARRWEELFGLPLRQGYGLTEAGPVCLFNRPRPPQPAGHPRLPLPRRGGVDPRPGRARRSPRARWARSACAARTSSPATWARAAAPRATSTATGCAPATWARARSRRHRALPRRAQADVHAQRLQRLPARGGARARGATRASRGADRPARCRTPRARTRSCSCVRPAPGAGLDGGRRCGSSAARAWRRTSSPPAIELLGE